MLERDQVPREMLQELLTKCLPVDQVRGMPVGEVARLIANKGAVYIKGQRSDPVTVAYKYEFPRNRATRDLLEALAHYRYLGSRKHWNFEHGEKYKRIVSSWVRKNGPEVLESLQPSASVRKTAVESGAAMLCIASLIGRRKELPPGEVERLDLLFKAFEASPVLLASKGDWSKESWAPRVEALKNDHAEIRRTVLAEVDVPQGTTAQSITFIDPLPILDAVEKFIERCAVPVLPQGALQGRWGPRFKSLQRADLFENLSACLEEERKALSSCLGSIRAVLKENKVESKTLATGVEVLCGQVKQLARVLTEEHFPVPHPEFDRERPRIDEVVEKARETDGSRKVPGVYWCHANPCLQSVGDVGREQIRVPCWRLRRPGREDGRFGGGAGDGRRGSRRSAPGLQARTRTGDRARRNGGALVTRIETAIERVSGLKRKRERAGMVNALRSCGKEVADTVQSLRSISSDLEKWTLILGVDSAKDAKVELQKATRDCSNRARRILEQVERDIACVTDPKFSNGVSDLKGVARGAAKSAGDEWSEALRYKVALLGAQVNAARFGRPNTLLELDKALASISALKLPLSDADASRVKLVIVEVRKAVSDAKVSETLAQFVEAAQAGRASMESLKNPEIRDFLDRNDLWSRLTVKLA